ncbi:hypothetical protein ARALYDRAFT_477959 [Arabidopsis lyrata subsp. lyrata]|uniref:BP28 C-terminal domain-containing protein n=1 Tax=Arabidopsis lyrata subsp. lyrata TaxID=81972 RepID=D7L5J0_ARALL|nr:hypothetical protein ARALYDRAFT_477959 [Arabidopsis lyrata subsp. lyrata]
MSSSIVSQLQALKSVLQADTEPSKRPFTRPSILFSPKEAADFDIESIYELGLKGLEVLGNKDERFKNYMNDLFSHKSREVDRELLGKEENARIDASISSYLRLLSGYLQFRASLETLEYLIRRYKIHIYNVEDVVLCALPYHDTHAFVRIVQLLSTGNSKWKFLDGVKNSGAPPPRSVIVQQCIRDLEVLETLCDYASRTKKYQPSKPVVSFSTAVVVGVLGSVPTVDGDIVKRILPFVDSGLQSGVKGCLDQQAGALMVVGMLANRAMLNSNLIKRFMRSIIDTAREHAKESSDPHSLRLSFMALINFVQLQSVDLIPRKALDLLNEISSSDDQCCEALASIIEAVPVNNLVDHLISKVFSLCMTQYQKNSDFRSSTSGSWAKKILVVVSKKYPVELREAVSKFLEATEGQSKKEDLKLEMLSCMLDGNSDMSNPFVDSKLWFRLHHPRAAVRCAALSSLNGVLKDDSSKAENLVTIQDAILRQLWDDDLAVVQAALSFDKLPNIVTSSGLLDALLHVVKRCVGILLSGVSHNVQLANDVVALSLKIAVSSFSNQADSTEKVTSAMFPFLLIQPKTWNLNLHVLKLGKDVNWPLFKNLGTDAEMKKLPDIMSTNLSSISMDIINNLGEALSLDPDERRIELIESACNFKLSEVVKTCSNIKLTEQERNKLQKGLLIRESVSTLNMDIINKLMDAFMMHPADYIQWLTTEWEELEVELDVSLKELLKSNCQELLYQLLDTSDFTALNSKLLICLLMESSTGFCFISSRVFLCCFSLLADVPPGVQIESLKCFSYLCSCGNNEWLNRIFSSFPVLLVPMSSANQVTPEDLKVAAMNCIEALFNLRWSAAICGSSFDELLGMIVQQRRLILSDNKFLPSYLTSLLSSTSNDLLVPVDLQKRFDQSTKENILSVILLCVKDLPAYGKLRVLSLLKDLGIMLLRDEIVKLLSQLLDKRSQDYLKLDKTLQPMSDTEVDLLCLLLECSMMRSASFKGQSLDDYILSALKVDCMASERSAIISPCLTILEKLSNQFYVGLKSEVQIRFFHILVSMFRSSNGSIQNGAKEAVLRLKISSSTVVHALDHIIQQDTLVIGSLSKKKKQKKSSKSSPEEDVNSGEFLSGEKALSFIAALLDMLLLKKDLAHRESLVRPLFKLLERSMSKEWVKIASSVEETSVQPPQDVRETTPASISSIQQTLLLILKDIFDSLNMNPLKAEIANEINVKMLVELAHSSNDGVTRNHIFSLFTAIVKFVPDRVLDHIISILTLVGESTVTQIDSHSKSIFEGFISVVIPFWLSKTKSEEQLLLIFVKVLPDIVQHRRRSIVAYLLGVVTSLLQQQLDRNGTKKVLGLISERAKDTSSSKLKHKRKISNQKARNPWLHLDEVAVDSFGKMCEEIVHLIDETDDESGVPAKRAAISTLEVLAGRFPSGHPIFSKCLASVAEGISSKNLGISSSCLRTTGALINVIGPKALVELPRIMKNLVKQSSEVSSASKSAGNTTAEEQLLMLSVLVTLEAVIDKLGGFLNPHLGDIMKVMVLHPEYVSDFDKNLKSKANTIRRLLTDKIPVRLTLQPLLRIYDEAVSSGNASLVIAFDMLENLVVKMDRSSIVSNHGKIFDQCLVALDIRRQNPAAIQNIDEAERSVTNAMVALTKKLTESEFRPLFIRSIDWAESDIVDGSGSENKNIDRAISFYGLVNRLCESHRSIFVPYFKYVLDGIVSHLTSAEASVSTRKKKKAKIQETSDSISPKSWHLRALVISSLKNCFLHDTGSLKFLDTNNFQVLLKPIVSQLVVEPPSSLKEHQHVPSVDEVDELLVSCIGQMAVASGSDLLWKPLNHEVLMQTRSENLRSRILSLRSVKQMLDNLKEEYLVLLAETIPFLGELLEDVELSVKSLAQDIIKQMEEMSGESLTQYL